MRLLDIGVLAGRVGLPVSTLRYYDEIGLVRSVSRKGLRRQFSPGAELQLKLIGLAKAAGFSLDEIAEMISPEGAPEIPRARLREKAAALDQHIRELRALRDTLRHVADCPAPSHLECPSFRQLLNDLSKKR